MEVVMHDWLADAPAYTMVVSLALYFFFLVRGKTVINLSTWCVTVGTYFITTITFYGIHNGDWDKMKMYYWIAGSLVLIFFYALRSGNFEKFKKMDWLVVGLAVIAVNIWAIFGGDWANALIQVAVFIGFLPMVEKLMAGVIKDNASPWLIGMLANIFQIFQLHADKTDPAPWFAYVNPILIGVGVNLLVAYTVLSRRAQEASA